MSLTHLSLFSGIGGLDLAAEWAGFETVGQCEFAEYPTKVLEKHWPDVPKWKDVRSLNGESFRERTGFKTVDCISGGFPCQPHSAAGKHLASADERDLWPEYRRIVGELRPNWVVAENVRGLLSSEDGRFFRGILRDLAEMGYDAGWCTYPAAWVGAIHRRERIFTVAYATCERWGYMDKIKQNQCESFFTQNLDYTQTGTGLVTDAIDILRAGERALYLGGGTDIRNDDGLSPGVDRIRCLGNAVMPQQAYPIFAAIAELERIKNEKT